MCRLPALADRRDRASSVALMWVVCGGSVSPVVRQAGQIEHPGDTGRDTGGGSRAGWSGAPTAYGRVVAAGWFPAVLHSGSERCERQGHERVQAGLALNCSWLAQVAGDLELG